MNGYFDRFHIPPNTIASLDTDRGIVSQNELKKIYRAKHAKLAKAPPIPFFYRNLPWRPLRSLRETRSYSHHNLKSRLAFLDKICSLTSADKA
jgi:hypothetical protein